MRPLIAVIGERREIGEMPYHVVGEKYLRAVSEFANGLPVLLTSAVHDSDILGAVDRFDGFLFCGSTTNIDPAEWDARTPAVGPFDQERDRLSRRLIKEVLARSAPSLFICRGMQELNVACGGTLHVEVAKVEGRLNHHSPEDLAYDGRYAPLHSVKLTPGSHLRSIFKQDTFPVNSLHYQAIDQVAPTLEVEAVADDGTPEAISLRGHPFAIGVQWHPEYRPELSPQNRDLLAAFGAAALQYAKSKSQNDNDKRD